jgi:hypothetical protein
MVARCPVSLLPVQVWLHDLPPLHLLPAGFFDEGSIVQVYNPAGPDAWKGDATLWWVWWDNTSSQL